MQVGWLVPEGTYFEVSLDLTETCTPTRVHAHARPSVWLGSAHCECRLAENNPALARCRATRSIAPSQVKALFYTTFVQAAQIELTIYININ